MTSCDTCKHYFRADDGSDNGYCRRFPPTVFIISNTPTVRSEFPPMKAFGLCGEFAAKLEAIQ